MALTKVTGGLLGNLPTGTGNVAVGDTALDSIESGAQYNVAIGSGAGAAITTGTNNTFVGGLAGDAFTDADFNVGIGKNALGSDTLGSKSTAIGTFALETQNFTTATDALNTAVGYYAGLNVTTGVQNTLIGGQAGDALNTSNYNTIVGYGALSSDTKGERSTAVGQEALASQNFTSFTVTGNTALGFQAGRLITTGQNNTLVGAETGDQITTGASNTAVGTSALGANTTGAQNTVVGSGAGDAITTGGNNVVLGFDAGGGLTTGSSNVFVGRGAGSAVTTSTFNTLLGQDCNSTSATAGECNGLGFGIAAASGFTTIGITSSDIRAAHGVATWATVSDERYKKDVVDSEAGLSLINALRPRTFKYKTLGELPETFNAYEEGSTEVFKNTQTNHGFIAQEVKAAIDADDSIKDGFRLWDEREDGSQEVAEAALIPVLVKAIQEQQTLIESLTDRIAALEA